MKNRKYPQLQYMGCWIITSITCGSKVQCEAVLVKDGLDAIFQLLYESGGEVLEQALMAVGNIAADCNQCRDTVIMKGGV